MTAQQYKRISAPFRGAHRTMLLRLTNTVLTRLCYLLYPAALAVLAWHHDERLLKAVLVPAVSFVILSIFRHVVNAPRPYVLLEIDPIIVKKTKGYSFPSRHVFSCFVIAMTFLWLEPWLGVVLMLTGTVLAACRVIGGVHFPRDVIVGAAVGIAAGMIYFI